MQMKETLLKLNKKEVDVLLNALDNQKVTVKIKTSSNSIQRRELAINELYNIESIEKKIKGIK
jgi:methyl coenzyme M reductase beta subunit